MISTWMIGLVSGLGGFGLGVGATVGWLLSFGKTEDEASQEFLTTVFKGKG